jgi:hypothetical protein
MTKEWTPGRASHALIESDALGSRERRRHRAVQRRVESVREVASPTPTRQRSFFWPTGTQQVARMARALSLRDVSAAIATAGAFALWALALSLLVV